MKLQAAAPAQTSCPMVALGGLEEKMKAAQVQKERGSLVRSGMCQGCMFRAEHLGIPPPVKPVTLDP